MEKLKHNYFQFNFILIIILSLVVFLFYYFGIIEKKLIPYMLLIGPYIAIFIYFAEKKAKTGYYFSKDGILIKNKKNEIFIAWEEIKLNKSSKKYKIQLVNNESISPFNIIDQDSLLDLTKKYCPSDHELYKEVQKYAKEKKYLFLMNIILLVSLLLKKIFQIIIIIQRH